MIGQKRTKIGHFWVSAAALKFAIKIVFENNKKSEISFGPIWVWGCRMYLRSDQFSNVSH